jgi:hypothetical protein
MTTRHISWIRSVLLICGLLATLSVGLIAMCTPRNLLTSRMGWQPNYAVNYSFIGSNWGNEKTSIDSSIGLWQSAAASAGTNVTFNNVTGTSTPPQMTLTKGTVSPPHHERLRGVEGVRY